MMDVLVIGYGNELRGDDGIGPHVARAVAALGQPGVRTVAVHQLTPELAEDVARAGLVIFVDARTGGEGEGEGEAVRVRPIEAGGQVSALGHNAAPRWLLALARDLYDRMPPAWWVTIAGQQFAPGDDLSPAALVHCREALQWVENAIFPRSRPCASPFLRSFVPWRPGPWPSPVRIRPNVLTRARTPRSRPGLIRASR
jgi:hydrogenase maturation protease